jgi:glycosyltransferase involved in cell wall biosynthesis
LIANNSKNQGLHVGLVTAHKLQGYGVSVRINKEIDAFKRRSVPLTVFSLVETGSVCGHNVIGINEVARRITNAIGFDRLANTEYVVRKMFSRTRLKSIAKNSGYKMAGTAADKAVTLFHSDDFLGSIVSLYAKEKMSKNPFVIGEFADLIYLDYMERLKVPETDQLVVDLKDMLCEVFDKLDFAFFVSPIDRDIAVKDLGIDKRKTEVLFESADKEVLPKIKYSKEPKSVCFLGSLSSWEFPELLIEAIKKFSVTEKPLCSIIGSGPLMKRMKTLSSKDPSFIFHGWHPYVEALKLAMQTDLGLICTRKKRAMPSKLFVYASIGLPMISMEGMWWSDYFVKNYDIGYLAAPSVEGVKNSIQTALNDPLALQEKGQNARKLIDTEFNWDSRIQKILNPCEDLGC